MLHIISVVLNHISCISKMKKCEVLSILDVEGINYDPSVTCIESRQFLKQWILNNIEIVLVTAAKNEGLEVLFTPPYHLDFQHIELLWSFITGNIGRSYCFGTILLDVKEKLILVFSSIQSGNGNDLIDNLSYFLANRYVLLSSVTEGEIVATKRSTDGFLGMLQLACLLV